jgi:hypothetical protein
MTGAWESGRVAGRKILRKLALANLSDETDPNRS